MKIIPNFRKFLAATVCMSFLAQNGLAADLSSLISSGQSSSGLLMGSEYVSGNYPGAILIPVNLWGSVNKAGIHHIPTQTDLLTLISLAGGPAPDAETNHVLIKRSAGKKEEIIKVDIQEILSTPGARGPILEANDIVVFPREKPVVGSNTLTVISFVGGVLGVVLASIALANQVKH